MSVVQRRATRPVVATGGTPDLQGASVGLDLAHDRRYLLRAGLESVVSALRTAPDVVSDLIGKPSSLLPVRRVDSFARIQNADRRYLRCRDVAADHRRSTGVWRRSDGRRRRKGPARARSVRRLLDYPERLRRGPRRTIAMRMSVVDAGRSLTRCCRCGIRRLSARPSGENAVTEADALGRGLASGRGGEETQCSLG